jgi:uncharacterized protein (TIGR02271 family)
VIRPGAGVEATDGRLGSVDEVRVRPETGELALLVVRRGRSDALLHVAAAQVERVDGDGTVRLRVTRAAAEQRAAAARDAGGGEATGGAAGQQLRVPILAERLAAAARPVELGELRVHTRVDAAEEAVRRAVERDELDVERVPVNRPLEAPVAQRTEGEWLVIPVMEEVLVVRTQLMLKEELRVRTRRVTAEQEVRQTVRRGRVELEDATRDGGRGLPEPVPAPTAAPDPDPPAGASPPAGPAPPTTRADRNPGAAPSVAPHERTRR